MSSCTTYLANPCLYGNAEQVVDDDDIEIIVIADTYWAPTQTAANCIALETATAEHYEAVCLATFPIADPQELTTELDTPLLLELTGTGAGTLIFTIVTEPLHGSISCIDEDCIYTPDSGYEGSDLFTFTVTADDGRTSLPATVTIDVVGIAFEATYITLTYEFTDGLDLDTATVLTTPVFGNDVGWCRDPSFSHGGQLYYEWAGDNTGTGFESVLIYVGNIASDFPAGLITGTCAGNWYALRESGDVQLVLTAYLGGVMVEVPGFRWENVGGVVTAVETFNGNVALEGGVCQPVLECITGFTYNIATNVFTWISC